MELTLRAQSANGERHRSPVGKIFGVGMNYHSFVAEAVQAGMSVPEHLIWFSRPASCIVGGSDDIWLPSDAQLFDYEAEIAIAIGTPCRRVSIEDAHRVIAGYLVANDLTLREKVATALALAKAFDTHLPLGPCVVPTEQVSDPHALRLRTWVNGELRQDCNSSDMITDCFTLVSELSNACTLMPGDIVLTGTPAGCGLFARPRRGLAVNDVVRIEIEGIGVIENRIVAEPAPPPLTAIAQG